MQATFRQLKMLVALGDTGSITGAAKACHVTQPTVSMQLKDLADAIGMPLYEQVGKRLHLTEAGQALLRTARAVQDEWELFEQEMAALKGLQRGRLKLAVASTAKYFVPRMLGRFCTEHPGIDISLQVLNRDGVLQRLRDNLDDLYVLSMPPDDVPHEREALLPNPLVVIAPPGHALAAARRVRWQRLQSEAFILRERGSGTRLAADAHFARLGLAPRVRLELGSNEAVKQSVAGGMGLGLISRHALSAAPQEDHVAILPVQRFPVPSSWWLLWPQGKRLSPLAQEFRRHLLALARTWEAHT